MKPALFVMVGLPASGKSTWAKSDQNKGSFRISSDDLIDMSGGYSKEKQKIIRYGEETMAREALLRGTNVIIDRTNLSSNERKRWKKIARDADADYVVVLCDVPLEEAITRNAVRDNPVPEDAIRRMFERYEKPSEDEGFDNIIRGNDE